MITTRAQKTMVMRSTAIAASLFAILASSPFTTPAAAVSSTDVVGIWYDSMKDGAIEVVPCGKKFCGHIVWTKQKESSKGGSLVDVNNPVESMRKRPICGLKVLRDLQPLTDGTVGRGVVYDPKKGQENEASLKRLNADQLQLTGYGLFGLSKSFVWTRAPGDIPRCDGKPAVQPGTAAGGGAAPIAGAAAAAAPAAVAKPKPVEAGVTAPPPKPAAANAAPIAAPTATVKPAAAKPASPAAKPPAATANQKPAQKPPAPTADKPQSAAPATKTTAAKTAPAQKPVATAKPPTTPSKPTATAAKPTAPSAAALKPTAKPAASNVAVKPAAPAKPAPTVAKPVAAKPAAPTTPTTTAGTTTAGAAAQIKPVANGKVEPPEAAVAQ